MHSYLLYSEQPHDWDEDEDGIWRPPKIPNPAYKGPWKPKVCRRVLETTKQDWSYFIAEITFMGLSSC